MVEDTTPGLTIPFPIAPAAWSPARLQPGFLPLIRLIRQPLYEPYRLLPEIHKIAQHAALNSELSKHLVAPLPFGYVHQLHTAGVRNLSGKFSVSLNLI
jgi:hypothetical protein